MTPPLEIDPARLAQLGREPFAVRHRLAEHPLLGVDALAHLADSLPADSVEHNLGNVPLVAEADAVERLETTPGEIVRGIDSNGCWMVLKNVEQDPAYSELLDACLADVAPRTAEREGGVTLKEAFVFLSAPGSVTPSHVDPEHNFLLQIRGTKEFNVGRFADAETEQRELERFYGGGHRNIAQTPDDMQTFALAPGDGIYVWPNAPHYVVNGPTVSVSFSITWQTRATRRAARVHNANGRLRALRVSPRGPGERVAVDRVKSGAVGALSAVRRRVSREAA
jgi:Cupin superfamily protein